jgi:polysaccharide deacetylase family protein (PEP-CTERM system associated)
MINALTVDVEDYHNLLGRNWLNREGPPTDAVVRNTHRVLELFAEHRFRGTFFVLGEVAATFPSLVRDIASQGHELGVHGYYHHQVFKLAPEAFRREVGDAKKLIEDESGLSVEGHRAPAFSIVPHTAWALDVLAEEGFRYDSSVFPIAGRRYGWPGFPLDIHRMTLASGRSLIEVPMSTVTIAGFRLPSCGGGYLRHFPGLFTRWAMRHVQRRRPVIFYMHPYEIEIHTEKPDTSALDLAAAAGARRFHRLQIRNRHTVECKLIRLLTEFRFGPLREVIAQVVPCG